MSKRKPKQTDIDVPEPRIGRNYKLWSERSDKDFRRWLRMQSYLSPLYRVAYLISGIVLLLIGLTLLITDSQSNGAGFMAVGFGLLLLIVLGRLIKI